MKKKTGRTPRFYDGVEPTTRRVDELLPGVMRRIGARYQERPDLIFAAWPAVIGEQLAPMTQVVSFEDGILTVKVKNSTLYSLLSRKDKPRILRSLRDKFPRTQIKNIVFRMG